MNRTGKALGVIFIMLGVLFLLPLRKLLQKKILLSKVYTYRTYVNLPISMLFFSILNSDGRMANAFLLLPVSDHTHPL